MITIGVLYLVTLFRPRHVRPTLVHGVVALFERSADDLFIVRHTADGTKRYGIVSFLKIVISL
jgi:hypothetical protein